jgi:hypothetical protein
MFLFFVHDTNTYVNFTFISHNIEYKVNLFFLFFEIEMLYESLGVINTQILNASNW